jgi:hypothetical protein
METPSPSQDGPLALTQDEARRLTDAARARGTTAALLGGIAVYLRCPCAGQPPLQREYKDIDLVTSKSMVQRLTELLQELGHTPDKRFNALHGSERLFFWDERNGRQLDVFVDRFAMSHAFDFRRRLEIDPLAPTLPLADLLLTKMQVVEINFKDMQDIAALLQDHPFTEDEEGINIAYITKLTRGDWGLQRTLEITAGKLRTEENLNRLAAPQARCPLVEQLDTFCRALSEAPKSTGWKLRDKIGERKRWYELPEEARA